MSFNYSVTLAFGGVALLCCLCTAQLDYQTLSQTEHNQLRSKHGSQNINQNVTLNQQAEACAQDYAQRNTIDHLCAKNLKKGENLYIYWTSGAAPLATKAMDDAITSWYAEVKGYNYNDPAQSTGVTGHFTQLVWNASTKIGCGVKTVQDRTVACCLYDPPGNMQGGTGGYEYYKTNVKPPTS